MINTKLPAIARGESKRYEFTIIDIDKDPVDITGWTMLLEFVAVRTETVVASASVTVSDGSSGECYGILTSAQTNVSEEGVYKVTLSRTDTGYESVLAVLEFPVLSTQLGGLD